MQKFYDTVLKANGKPAKGVLAHILNYPAGTAATIYIDNGLTQQDNPITTDENGFYQFYAANGRYSIELEDNEIITRQIDDISIFDTLDNTNNVYPNVQITNSSFTGGTIQLTDAGFMLYDNLDNSKTVQFQLSAISAATARVYTLPDANGTLVLAATTLGGYGITDGLGTGLLGQPNGVAQLDASGNLVQNTVQGADVAAASTINLTAATGSLLRITGNTQINAVTLADGKTRECIFTGSPILAFDATNQNLNSGGKNVQITAGDRIRYFAISGVVYGEYTSSLREIPVGGVIEWYLPTIPANYIQMPLVATAISRTAYPVLHALYAADGYPYGNGDGSTTFNIQFLGEDLTTVQENSNVGTSTNGELLAHTHDYISLPSGAGQPAAGASFGTARTTFTTTNQTPAGGTANKPGGIRVKRLIKYK